MATDSLRHAVVRARLWAITLPLPAAFAAAWVALPEVIQHGNGAFRLIHALSSLRYG